MTAHAARSHPCSHHRPLARAHSPRATWRAGVTHRSSGASTAGVSTAGVSSPAAAHRCVLHTNPRPWCPPWCITSSARKTHWLRGGDEWSLLCRPSARRFGSCATGARSRRPMMQELAPRVPSPAASASECCSMASTRRQGCAPRQAWGPLVGWVEWVEGAGLGVRVLRPTPPSMLQSRGGCDEAAVA